MTMKIAVISSHTQSLIWFRMDMMKAFCEAGHEVIAVANDKEDKWNSVFNAVGIRYRRINVDRNGKNLISDLRTICSIYSVLRSEKPDKIFIYQAKTIIYGCAVARILGIKEVYSLVAGIGSIFLTKDAYGRIFQAIMSMGYKLAFRSCNRVFFQNMDDSSVFVERGIVPKEKIVYINGSGVNIDEFTPLPLPDEPTFLFIGRLIRDKGIIEYLNACRLAKKRNGNIRCLLVGPFDTNPSGIKPNELALFVEDGSVEYFGEQKDVRPYIGQCSIFVLPSYHEGTPKTVLEAMACGRPIIVTDAPGCKETVEAGTNGFLVPIKDDKSLAEMMLFMAERHEIVEEMGKKSRHIAITKYDVRIVNRQIAETMGIL